ncbi:MAG: protein kinase, partial [Myxococcaceae bacterium]|nr:protein kinase [Myxococcaceae bacterium]
MIGGYEVVRRMSEGASAEVLLARNEESQERVIVELIRPELFAEEELVTRFLDEARARRSLSHPNVARRVREGTAADGRPFLVSEPVGETLADRLAAQGPLSLETMLKLALPLCDAVHYLHAQGLVHGNLKPSTVHLGPDGMPQRPKLVDYGLALFRPGRTLPRPPGRVLVEPEYLAPERVRGQRGTASSDVYALGVLLYEALTGAPPFTGDAAFVRRAQLELPPPPLPEAFASVEPILRRCLAKVPSERFPDAAAVRDALELRLEGTLPLPPPLHTDDAPASVPRTGDVETGDRVGRYELLEPIGEGAMGRVFLARHARLG